MDFPRQTLSLNKLILDTSNARHGDLTSEADSIKWMLTDYRAKKKTYKLAKAISEQGLSPIDEILVVPKDDSSEYVVVEGNRRVTALKLLLNPDLAPSASDKRLYRQLAKDMTFKTPKSIECRVAPGIQEASYWIRLRHGGEQDGIGTVPWGSKELERFNHRIGRRGPNSKSMEVLDYAYENKLLNEEQIRAFPVTNLTRLVNDPGVRVRMGIEATADSLRSTINEPSFRKGLALLLKELADSDVTVTNIKLKDQRRDYITGVMKRAGVKIDHKATKPYDIKGSKHFYTNGTTLPQPRGRGRRTVFERKTMIPGNFRLTFSTPARRLRDIFQELQHLKVEECPNAVAVLFRVFFEGCLDRYGVKQKISGYHADGDKLAKRTQQVIQDLKQIGKIDKKVAIPVEVFLTSPNSFGSITSFHSFVHNMAHHPLPRDLKTSWDNLAPFFEALDGCL